MRPDLDECARCTALELIGPVEMGPITALTAAAPGLRPIEGSKSWRPLPTLEESFDRPVDEEYEAELNRLARNDILDFEPGVPARRPA